MSCAWNPQTAKQSSPRLVLVDRAASDSRESRFPDMQLGGDAVSGAAFT